MVLLTSQGYEGKRKTDINIFREDLILKHHEAQATVHLYIPNVFPRASSVLSRGGHWWPDQSGERTR